MQQVNIKLNRIRKLYQHKKLKKIFLESKNNYIVFEYSNCKLKTLSFYLNNMIYFHNISYFKLSSINQGGQLIKIIPVNSIHNIEKINKPYGEILALWYNNQWYPGMVIRNMNNYKNNLFSILLEIKNRKKSLK